MFSGKYEHTVDAKGRVFVPAIFREELGGTFHIARGFGEPYLTVYPEAEYRKIVEKFDALGMNKDARLAKRYFTYNSKQVEMDGQGRFVLSPELRAFADLGKNVTVLGSGKVIELWNTEALEKSMSAEPEGYENILSQISQIR